MEEQIDIILSAIDDASDTFQGVADSATEMSDALQTGTDEASSGFDEVESGADNAKEAIDGMADLMAFQAISEYVTQLADTMWDLADRAGNVQDSWTRVGLAAEGAGINIDDMKGSISGLASETGRSGGAIRESFIAMSSAGVSELGVMEDVFKGASAQAFILGTDVDTLVNKFSGMAMKSSIAEKTLKGTGITVEELGEVLGIQGATIDDVNSKWETMDTDARAAALGQAAAMNEGKEANDEYKSSWEGLQAQIDIAKGKLEVMIGNVLLPVLIPALQAAGDVLSWLGDTMAMVMDGPLGGFISVIGSLGAGLLLAFSVLTAVKAGMGFFAASLQPAIVASWELLLPWLPWIALGAAIIAIIYEIGRAFGWWDDASGMIDAISAGLQRLWDAFINHPDVQAAIQVISDAWNSLTQAIGEAWNGLMEFFGASQDGSFDIVRALIDGLGEAWNHVREPIMALIDIISTVITTLWNLRNGNVDVTTAITDIWNAFVQNLPTILMAIFNLQKTIWTAIGNLVVRLVRSLVDRVSQFFRSLKNKVVSILLGVVSGIRSAIQAWIDAASQKVSSLINDITSPFSGVASSIGSALSGVKNAIVKPFQDAYNEAKKWVDKVTGLGGARGGEEADGRQSLLAGANKSSNYSVSNEPVKVEQTLTLDFQNVPTHISTSQLITALTDKNVLNALTSNTDFQTMDNRVKQRILLKNNRAGGI